MNLTTMCVQTFFPVSRINFDPVLPKGKRYRHSFNDKRLEKRHSELVNGLIERGTTQLNALSTTRNQEVAFGRFLANDSVSLSEVIHENTRVEAVDIEGRNLLLLLDASSFNLSLNGQNRKKWKDIVGVVSAENTPGFMIMPCLILDRDTSDCIGLGDIVFYSHPPAHRNKKKNQQARSKRHRLPLEQKETGSWLMAARNTVAQLKGAANVSVVLDQGGDAYDLFPAFKHDLKVDFIIRSKYNRKAVDPASGLVGTLPEVLSTYEWQERRFIEVRELNHFSKTRAKRIKRKRRVACLNIKFTKVIMFPPDSPSSHAKKLVTLYVVEVKEDPATVPAGEEPIHWRLLTSCPVKTREQAWAIVRDYGTRWHIEQLFRVVKKDGFQIEKSQLDHPERIKKILVMALKASAEVIRLVNARSGEPAIKIGDVYTDKEQQVLHKLNPIYEGNTEKQSNPHQPDTLAYAVWIISRMGGWNGYASQRPPGPKIIKRGLEQFYAACRYADLFDRT